MLHCSGGERSNGVTGKSRSQWFYGNTVGLTGNQLQAQRRRHQTLVSQCRYGNTTTLAASPAQAEVTPYHASTLLLDKYSTCTLPANTASQRQGR